jgi:hypothetical protein
VPSITRFIVEAVSADYQGDVLETLLIGVPVSLADDGAPVTGLTADNFRIAWPGEWGKAKDIKVATADEAKWEPGDSTPSGCYQLGLQMQPPEEFVEGYFYTFGIRVHEYGPMPTSGLAGSHPLGRPLVGQGQTILYVMSQGR